MPFVPETKEPLTDAQASFIDSINDLSQTIHATAVSKGWWDGDRNNGELIALIHSEASEALEALRHGNGPSDHIPEFSGAEEEMADVIIRVLDMSAARGWRIGEAIIEKMRFNDRRAFRHGGKVF